MSLLIPDYISEEEYIKFFPWLHIDLSQEENMLLRKFGGYQLSSESDPRFNLIIYGTGEIVKIISCVKKNLHKKELELDCKIPADLSFFIYKVQLDEDKSEKA